MFKYINHSKAQDERDKIVNNVSKIYYATAYLKFKLTIQCLYHFDIINTKLKEEVVNGNWVTTQWHESSIHV